MEFKFEVANDDLIELLETDNCIIIKKLLEIVRSYDLTKSETEDFRCMEEIVDLLNDNGYDCGPCHDF